jgi:hypothetical protein
MTFTFKRDNEGRETVYADGVLIATISNTETFADAHYRMEHVGQHQAATSAVIADAMDRAWAKNFWPNFMEHRRQAARGEAIVHRYDELSVEVSA